MKIYKLLISTLFGVILAILGLSAFSAYADDTTPTISTELEYVVIDDEQLVKASIYISNFEPVSCGGFHIELGDGFVFDADEDFGGIIHYNCQGTTSSLVGNVFFTGNAGTHSAFVVFVQPNAYNMNINGKFLEVYLKKTTYANQFNSTFNLLLLNNQYASDFFADSNNNVYYDSSNTNVPHMYKSALYVLGDVDGNGIVNSADATAINTILAQYPYSYNISDIEDSYYYLFPYYALQAEDGGVFDDPMATAFYLELLVREQNVLVAKIDNIAITNGRGYAVAAFNSNENVNISVINEFETDKAHFEMSIIKPDGIARGTVHLMNQA